MQNPKASEISRLKPKYAINTIENTKISQMWRNFAAPCKNTTIKGQYLVHCEDNRYVSPIAPMCLWLQSHPPYHNPRKGPPRAPVNGILMGPYGSNCMSVILCIDLVLWQAGNALTIFHTSLYCILPMKFPENGGVFHHTSVYCFTECHLYTTETLQWTMQFVLECYFFEFECLFWTVCQCPQLQAKWFKWTIWGMISDKNFIRCALCAIRG